MRASALPPAIPALILSLVVTAVLFAALAAAAAPARAGVCEQAIDAASRRHGVDRNLMLAIGRVESGLTPWVLNAEGAGERFASKSEAVARVADLQAQGVSSIDVGCMQVNLRWHPEAFSGLEQAFDPYYNADYAARYLRRLRVELGSWTRAAVRYHSASPERQALYGCAIQTEFDRLRQVAARPCVYRPNGRNGARRVGRPVQPEAPAGTTMVLRPAEAPATAAAPQPAATAAADSAASADRPAPPRSHGAPEIIRLGGEGSAGESPIAMLRGRRDRPAAAPAETPADPPGGTPALTPYEPRARVLRLPGASEPAAVSVIAEDAAAAAGFALD